MKDIYIIYASTSGNTELVCERIAEILQENKYSLHLSRAEKTNIDIIKDNSLFIFATSTWDHGVINPFFVRLLTEMEHEDFKNKHAGFVGCGDIRYEPILFCEGIETIKKLFLKNSGSQISHTLKINGDPYKELDTSVKLWAEQFGDLINKLV